MGSCPNKQAQHTRTMFTSEKTEGAIKNGQSRVTGNIGHTRHKAKTNKAKITTHVSASTIRKQTQHMYRIALFVNKHNTCIG